MSIAYVEFVKPITLKKANAMMSTAKASIQKGNPDGVELQKVEGGVELRWTEGAKLRRVLVPTANIACLHFEAEAAVKK